MKKTNHLLGQIVLLFSGVIAAITANAEFIKDLRVTEIARIDELTAKPTYQLDLDILAKLLWTNEDQENYEAECNPRRDERRKIIDHDLTIHKAADPEKYRCVQEVRGDLTIDTDNESLELVLPYLMKVTGDFDLKAGTHFDFGQFPKLYHVGGKLYINNRSRWSDWHFASFKYFDGTLEVMAGLKNPLHGLNNLRRVGRLRLYNHPNDIWGPFEFSGLEGLQQINGDLDIDLEWGSTSGNFLGNLEEVGDDVEISIEDGGLIGLGSIKHVGDDLIIHWDSPNYASTVGLESLEEVGGDFIFDGPPIRYLTGLQNLQSVGHDFELELNLTVNDLQDLSQLTSVGKLAIVNSNVASLNGLQNIQNLGALVLEYNYALNNVSALTNASVPGSGLIRIVSNWSLSTCEAQDLVRDLRNDQNYNQWNSSYTQVFSNDDC